MLGDSQSCAPSLPPPDIRIEDRLEPGPHAKYLMSRGLDKDEAIEQARASGESPTRHGVRITRNRFSSEALYRQAVGVTDLPPETIETKELR